MHAPDLTVQRIRHPLKMRLLQVRRTRLVAPHLLSITFTGDDLNDFVSASFDDHVKLFFPQPGASEPVLPIIGPEGVRMTDSGPRPIARDYTPRRYDAAAQELEIQFVLHGEGPAASWAAHAKPGDRLGIGGPRGSFVIPTGFDWFLMIGDETALPAVGRRLEELPAGPRVIAVLEVDGDHAQLGFESRTNTEIIWIRRNGKPDPLETAVRKLQLPAGEGYVWAAGEAAVMRSIHTHLVTERGVHKSRIRAASYWKRGAIAVHESLGD